MWAIDYRFDQTADGRILKLLKVVDEFTRGALAIECRRRIDADHTVTVLDRLVAARSIAPAFIRCDNGPELTANALRNWCRFQKAGSNGSLKPTINNQLFSQAGGPMNWVRSATYAPPAEPKRSLINKCGVEDLDRLIDTATRGDSELVRWTSKSLGKLRAALVGMGREISERTLGKFLKTQGSGCKPTRRRVRAPSIPTATPSLSTSTRWSRRRWPRGSR